MEEPVRLMAAESARETSAPCRRCGTPTSERLVLRAGGQVIRASLWLCRQCHQPQHRAVEDPACPESGEATTG